MLVKSPVENATNGVKIKSRDNKDKNNRGKYIIEDIAKNVFMISALVAVVSLLMIIGFVFYKGLTPFIFDGYSFKEFLTGTEWVPSAGQFGVAPMIAASLLATLGALLIGVPVGILTAVFIAEVAPKKLAKIISPAVELLAGIPSVLYGVFGLAVIVPTIQKMFDLPKGQSLLAVIIVLAVMMLPTIISVSETAIRAVPKAYKEGSLALGASKIETIFKVVIPAAKSGILAAVVLGVGRALGETMAVILVAGNSPVMPTSVMDSVRPLTTNIALEMGYAFGTHQEMLFATGVVLFTFILILNLVLSKLSSKAGD
ncbi:MAG: phosphate ABC transporter permease subunit PstC [Romboutsia sp.]